VVTPTRERAFALGTFARPDGEPFPGVVVGDRVVELADLIPGVRTTGELFDEWDSHLDAIAERLAEGEVAGGEKIGDLHVLPPVQPVGPVIAAGVNYREHIMQLAVAHKLGRAGATDDELRAEAAAESDGRQRSGDPYVWVGLPSAVCGAHDDVILPDVGGDVDWELELGVVIGRRAHRVAVADALAHVAGYTIVNDVTARTLVPRTDIASVGTDWFRAKSQPTFFPTGPLLVPARFVPDPSALRVELRLNGTTMQDSTTADLLFDVASVISYASSFAVLRPGDLVITGSPPGNGSHWGRFLRDGDVMEGTITGLGLQRNRVVGPSGTLPPWQASRR
jgi:2,4-diketo-3-deoxy-L-fuconate hydrolase